MALGRQAGSSRWYDGCAMSEHGPGGGEKGADTSIPVPVGSLVISRPGLIVHVNGPSTDGIRVSDSRGWTAAGDIKDGIVEMASASGIPSEAEHLTLETTEILVRRLKKDGATWGTPVLLEDRVGRGVDCEAPDLRDPGRPPLRVQVTRPKMLAGFWERISLDSKAAVPGGTAVEASRSLWDAIQNKRPAAQHGVLLAINAIRTPWLALPPIVESFRQQYGEAASREGWAAIWIVGANERFTERLDRAPPV